MKKTFNKFCAFPVRKATMRNVLFREMGRLGYSSEAFAEAKVDIPARNDEDLLRDAMENCKAQFSIGKILEMSPPEKGLTLNRHNLMRLTNAEIFDIHAQMAALRDQKTFHAAPSEETGFETPVLETAKISILSMQG